MRVHAPRSILLASGTLSPMSFLMEELVVPFGVQITNPHIIGDKQLFATVVKTGPGDVALSSSYRNRSDLNYLKSLGELIVQVFSVVPKGVLVFFPSYSVMEMCTKEWQSNGLWDTMLRKKVRANYFQTKIKLRLKNYYFIFFFRKLYLNPVVRTHSTLSWKITILL